MDQITAVLMAIFAICLLIVIGVYNKADSQRFRLDRALKREKEALEAWVAECERLQPGAAEKYRGAKKNWQKTACLQEMVTEVKENSERKLELQEQLFDFCYSYDRMAETYNKRVQDPFQGKILAVLGFRPYTPLDFFPGLSAAPREDGEK